MRFNVKSNLYGRWGIHVELSEYDALPPIQNVAYDATPLKVNPEVEAAAITLMFGRFSGGEMEFAHKIGPNTGKAIQRYLEPTISFVSPIEYYPKALPLGRMVTLVKEEDCVAHQRSSFISLNSDRFNGALKSHRSIAVANNSFVLKEDSSDIRPALASAMLFAEDLEVESFVVPVNSVPNFDEVQSLLSAVRLNLVAES